MGGSRAAIGVSTAITATATSGAATSGGWRREALAGWRRKTLAVLAVTVMVFAAVTAWVLVWPAQGAPPRVSAIVMLAGPGDRMPVALELARQHRAPVLVVSRGWMGYSGPCPPPVAGVRTICFDPNPGDTRGEAEFVGRLAAREGWHSLLVVASRPQAIRAQLIVGRCFSGQSYLATAPLPASSWPYEIAYGWGSLFKAEFLVRSC
jgi:hypothetical protein